MIFLQHPASPWAIAPPPETNKPSRRRKARHQGAAAPTETPVRQLPLVPWVELSYLTRRVLRIIAANPGIALESLHAHAQLDTPVKGYADPLVLLGLATRQGRRYTSTASGLHSLSDSTNPSDRALASRAAELLHTH